MERADDISKLKAAVLYLLKVLGGYDDFLYFSMTMYLIQKEYLVRYGELLFPDYFFASELMPVPAFTCDAFRHSMEDLLDTTDDMKRFASSFTVTSQNGISVWANEEPDMAELSAEEIRTIDTVVKKYNGQLTKQFLKESHDDAWQKALERGADDRPDDYYLSLVDIARAGGTSEEMLDYIRSNEEFEDYCRE